MRRFALWMSISAALVGCSLTGDITPPANVTTGQSNRTLTSTTEVSTPQMDIEIPTIEATQSITTFPSKGTITGGIENGTSGGTLPEDLEVNLIASDEQTLALSTKTMVDEGGRFIFEDLNIVAGRIYITYVEYEGVRYVSDPFRFPEGEVNIDLSMRIFETTDDDAGLHVGRLHLIFELAAEDNIGVTQVWIIDGLEDRTIIEGDGAGVVDVYLPEGFSNLGIDDSISPEGRYMLSDRGFIDRAPVQPGISTELVFSFTLPFKSSLDYLQSMKYAVDNVVILLASEEIDLRADGLEDLGRRDVAGTSLRSYSMEALESGEAIELRLRSNAAMIQAEDLQNILFLSAILLIAISLFTFIRQLRHRRESQRDETLAQDGSTDPQELIAAIAALDDAFETGEISAAAYRRDRAKLKDQALQIMRADDD